MNYPELHKRKLPEMRALIIELLNKGADPNKEGYWTSSSESTKLSNFYFAIWTRSQEIIESFLDHKADPYFVSDPKKPFDIPLVRSIGENLSQKTDVTLVDAFDVIKAKLGKINLDQINDKNGNNIVMASIIKEGSFNLAWFKAGIELEHKNKEDKTAICLVAEPLAKAKDNSYVPTGVDAFKNLAYMGANFSPGGICNEYIQEVQTRYHLQYFFPPNNWVDPRPKK